MNPLAARRPARHARDTVLVLARRYDCHADLVVKEFDRRGTPVVRCDAGEFPRKWTLESIWDGSGRRSTIVGEQGAPRMEQIRSVRVRRPMACQAP